MTECWINVYQTPSGKQYLARPCETRAEAVMLFRRDGFMTRGACRLRVRLKPVAA